MRYLELGAVAVIVLAVWLEGVWAGSERAARIVEQGPLVTSVLQQKQEAHRLREFWK